MREQGDEFNTRRTPVPRIHYDTQDAAARAFFVYLVGAVFAHDPEAGERLARALDFGHIVSR